MEDEYQTSLSAVERMVLEKTRTRYHNRPKDEGLERARNTAWDCYAALERLDRMSRAEPCDCGRDELDPDSSCSCDHPVRCEQKCRCDLECDQVEDEERPVAWDEHYYGVAARSGWVLGSDDPDFLDGLPGESVKAQEWRLTLAGGGPSVELRAERGGEYEIGSARLFYQNFMTRWTELLDPDVDREMLKRVAEGMIWG